MTSPKKEHFGIVGFGAAACAACCAAPILGVIAGIAAMGVFAATLFGLAAVVVAALAIGVVVLRRRRSTATCAAPGPVTVDAPIRRAPTAP